MNIRKNKGFAAFTIVALTLFLISFVSYLSFNAFERTTAQEKLKLVDVLYSESQLMIGYVNNCKDVYVDGDNALGLINKYKPFPYYSTVAGTTPSANGVVDNLWCPGTGSLLTPDSGDEGIFKLNNTFPFVQHEGYTKWEYRIDNANGPRIIIRAVVNEPVLLKVIDEVSKKYSPLQASVSTSVITNDTLTIKLAP